ncbi:hypothetical protein SMC26_06320 [Actinomadura fulvescens]|uniref:Uncharacterized protein n=1 Tax=Actinomadura fulvescens TaxID=46160 RepID=A0ABN3PKF7_9ACTN
MVRRYPAHPVRDAFAARLRRFYADCGRPRYKLIIELAPRLPGLYPDLENVTTTFSKSALSENLHGRRETMPDPAWLACFVLCCQRLGFESGHLAKDPGRASLLDWQRRLSEAEDEARRLGLPVRPGPHALPATATLYVPPDDDHGLTGPIRVSEAAYEHTITFGPYGRILLLQASARDPHAVYQVAVLLAADPARAQDALSLLTDAAATGHPEALALLQASPRHLDRSLAARHAHQLAKLANNAGFVDASLAFYECVARFTIAQDAIADTPHS